MKVVGLLLAGGQSRRMGGGDKALRLLGGIPLLDRVIERLRPQVDALVLNANGDPTRFAHFALPMAADTVPGFVGPLAGVLAGLDWAASRRPDCSYVVSIATDAPFLPIDLVTRLARSARRGARRPRLRRLGRPPHPVFGLWSVRLRDDLRRAVVDQGIRKVDLWTARHQLTTVSFPVQPVDPFFNANRPEDLETAAALLRATAG